MDFLFTAAHRPGDINFIIQRPESTQIGGISGPNPQLLKIPRAPQRIGAALKNFVSTSSHKMLGSLANCHVF